MDSPEVANSASPSDGQPEQTPTDEGLLKKFRYHEILDKLTEPQERSVLVEMMRAFEGPEESEEEDGRGLYHDALALLRYCRARKWNFQAAHDMLRSTGKWRKAFDFAGLVSGEYVESIAQENASGKLYVRGFDRRGRPAIVMRPGRENSSDNQAIIRHLAYCVERAVRCIDRQVEEGRNALELTDPQSGKFLLVVDFVDLGLSNLIPLSVARATIGILQDHYPERLGQAFLVDPPWILNAFFNAIAPFIDPVTLEKFQFVTEPEEARAQRFEKAFDLSVLEPVFGGTATEAFESPVFINCKRQGTEFGLEFNEQLAIAEEENAAAKLSALQEAGSAQSSWPNHLGGAILPAPYSFWGVSSDIRVLSLARKERGLVRELARVLSVHRDSTVEEHDGLFDDAGALIRYLRAQAWSPAKAEAKIRATARWRKDAGLAAQRAGAFAEALAREGAMGKMYVRGFDRRGRPILYIKLSGRDSRRHEDTIRYFVYCVERAVACVDQRLDVPAKPRSFGQDEANGDDGFLQADGKFVVLIDFAGYSRSHRPKMRTVREAMTILREHYPERLGDAYLLSPPMKVRALWGLFQRMIDPALYERVTLVTDPKSRTELLNTVFERSTMEKSVGGEVDMPFESHIFLHRQVNGLVYGSEFEAQASASGGGHAATRRVSWADSFELPLKEENEDSSTGWTFSLESLFGGTNSSLW